MNVNNAIVFAYLHVLGLPIGKKYGKLRAPCPYLSDKRSFAHFLAGLLDTDGYLHSGSIMLVQKDERFIRQLHGFSSNHLGLEFRVSCPFTQLRGGGERRKHHRLIYLNVI